MRVVVYSDLHYAGAAERSRRGFEARAIRNPLLRGMALAWRHWIWLRDPMAHNHRLEALIEANPDPDLVVVNGDFSLDSAFVGVSDDAALASASEALGRLRGAYGSRLLATMGDHELGKQSLFGGVGGLRLESWRRCEDSLALEAVWRRDVGPWSLVGIASTPAALPVFAPEMLPSERSGWESVGRNIQDRYRAVLDSIGPDRRILLFVHDPSALPFLAREASVVGRLPQVAQTIIGHLHTPSLFRLAQGLAGMPRIRFLGNTVRRYSSALREARVWREFRTVLCPSPPGIQLLKDGGWLELELPLDSAESGLRIRRHRLPWGPES
ncbi:MAG: metallophosphoesterase [Verrucomicrobiales bacterium]|nr:metallophosphoesterase [Verrucomicrobiales bacterium]